MDPDSGEPNDPLVGAALSGRYRIDRRVGAGGMGVVYETRDLELDRTVAVKVLPPHLQSDKDSRRRFHREIEMVASVDHEHVIQLYDADMDQGQLFFAMEYVEGADLSRVLDAGPLELDRALRIFGQVAGALDFLHSEGLVHRDIKPENVLLRGAGEPEEHVLLTDFGIARLVDSATRMTIGIGSKHYMAPEVVEMRDPSARSDQYSLACMLYRMLAGEHVFEGGEYPRVHVDEPVPDLEQRLPAVPLAIRAAVGRALSKKEDERFPSVAGFAQALSERAADNRRPRAQLHADLVEILQDAGTWLELSELTSRVNARRSHEHAVTELQVSGRIRTFPHLFQWRGNLIGLLG